jgi:hypothetical protein
MHFACVFEVAGANLRPLMLHLPQHTSLIETQVEIVQIINRLLRF